MKEPDTEELATHGDPESCVGVREGAGEALTGARTGRVLSHETAKSGVPTSWSKTEGNTRVTAMRGGAGPCGVVDSEHVRNILAREPGDLHVIRA
jgi:hypothetical protein